MKLRARARGRMSIMSFALIAVAICIVPVTGLVAGLVDLVRGDAGRKTIADAFEVRAADMSHC